MLHVPLPHTSKKCVLLKKHVPWGLRLIGISRSALCLQLNLSLSPHLSQQIQFDNNTTHLSVFELGFGLEIIVSLPSDVSL